MIPLSISLKFIWMKRFICQHPSCVRVTRRCQECKSQQLHTWIKAFKRGPSLFLYFSISISLSFWEGRNRPRVPKASETRGLVKRHLAESYMPSEKGVFALPSPVHSLQQSAFRRDQDRKPKIGGPVWLVQRLVGGDVMRTSPGGPCPHKGMIIPTLGNGSTGQTLDSVFFALIRQALLPSCSQRPACLFFWGTLWESH